MALGRAPDRFPRLVTVETQPAHGLVSGSDDGEKRHALRVFHIESATSRKYPSNGLDGTLDTEFPCTKGDLYLLIKPDVFPFFADRAKAAAEYLRQIRDSQPQPGTDAVRLPGDRSQATRTDRLENGIPLARSVWETVRNIHRELTGS